MTYIAKEVPDKSPISPGDSRSNKSVTVADSIPVTAARRGISFIIIWFNIRISFYQGRIGAWFLGDSNHCHGVIVKVPVARICRNCPGKMYANWLRIINLSVVRTADPAMRITLRQSWLGAAQRRSIALSFRGRCHGMKCLLCVPRVRATAEGRYRGIIVVGVRVKQVETVIDRNINRVIKDRYVRVPDCGIGLSTNWIRNARTTRRK